MGMKPNSGAEITHFTFKEGQRKYRIIILWWKLEGEMESETLL